MASVDGTFLWGKLIFTKEDKPPVLVSKDLVTLGRKQDCDISFAGSKFVSSHHCNLSRDSDGKVWLEDFSTNGSLLNGKKVTKKEKIQLNHKDHVQIVHRKDHPESDIAFVFHNLTFPKEDQSLLENTQEYVIDTEEEVSEDEDNVSSKRPHSETGDTDEGPATKKRHEEERGTLVEKEPKMVAHNSIADTLLCSICQDIFHDCVSLQPCIHSFCAACYSQWMDRSSDCPSCRKRVKRISKNHIVNNLVEAFLKEHPERCRSDEEMKEMDSRNKITEEMLRPKRGRRSSSFGSSLDDYDDADNDEDSEYDSEDDDEGHEDSDYLEDDEDSTSPRIIAIAEPASFGSFFGFASSRPIPTNCRLCPGYITPSLSPATSAASASEVGTASSRVPPDYTCTPDQEHELCQCCVQPMPKTWSGTTPLENIPPQKCTICSKYFCHMLWGCQKTGCLGCLNKFADFQLSENSLSLLINNNLHESQILKDYLTEQTVSKEDLLQKCLEKLDSKEYRTIDGRSHNLCSSTVVCYKCGLRNIQELAYQFRRDIPRDQLPDSVHSRTDCYWGKNCRTQRTKPLHASRFNHICEQTRFT
ncbi:E3 ubiquitin-protein ligase CHFR-like isoform X1 [Montipora foliosa]|uniref:E3 ubiquitin-protein ligase CHFR-like isoform X1 n=1 Tax=Montipora foliosa TaxID=591990 RepID=UPI0035F11EFD